jgi:hypothetical protein
VFNYQVIEFQGQKLIVRRRIRESSLIPGYSTEELMKWSRSDKLLRKEGYIWCCEIIQDAEIID